MVESEKLTLANRASAVQEVADTSEAYNRQRRRYGEVAEHPEPPPGAVAGACASSSNMSTFPTPTPKKPSL